MLGYLASNASMAFSVFSWRESPPHQLNRRVMGSVVLMAAPWAAASVWAGASVLSVPPAAASVWAGAEVVAAWVGAGCSDLLGKQLTH